VNTQRHQQNIAQEQTQYVVVVPVVVDVVAVVDVAAPKPINISTTNKMANGKMCV
jgi:hypothetical protein